ncbi:MAG: hypothetical protein IJS52_08460 [Bacilli bacterium]|nr:hypothetical protein [Bacilli bacterium]
MMDKSDELFTKTLEELSAMSARLEEISKVEETFQSRMDELTAKVEILYGRQKEIVDAFNLLNSGISDLEKCLSSVDVLEQKIGDLRENLAKIDVQGLSEKLDNTSDEIGRSFSKLVAAEKRSKEAKEKKNLGKK